MPSTRRPLGNVAVASMGLLELVPRPPPAEAVVLLDRAKPGGSMGA